MASKRKPLTRIEVSDLSVDDGLALAKKLAVPTREHQAPAARPEGKRFDGTAEEVVAALLSELRS